jgi:spermidine synthase
MTFDDDGDFLPGDSDRVKPFVHEDERTISLHFDISSIQSRMLRADPHALVLDYTRLMMAGLLLQPAPRALLMIGLGGGSLPKYCHRHLPAADITVVEINPHVIGMRDAFFVPPDDARFRVVCDDGAAFVARGAGAARCDLLMVDGFTYDGQPEALGTPAFYADCRSMLADDGVLVVNLHNEESQAGLLVERIAGCFGGCALPVTTADGGNRIVFAARGASVFERCAQDLDARWAALAEVHRRTLRGAMPRFSKALSQRLASVE